MLGFIVYGIWNHPKLRGDAKLLNHYVRIDNLVSVCPYCSRAKCDLHALLSFQNNAVITVLFWPGPQKLHVDRDLPVSFPRKNQFLMNVVDE